MPECLLMIERCCARYTSTVISTACSRAHARSVGDAPSSTCRSLGPLMYTPALSDESGAHPHQGRLDAVIHRTVAGCTVRDNGRGTCAPHVGDSPGRCRQSDPDEPHYPFDRWMHRTSPNCPFARCADDAVVHCHSRRQAEYVMRSIATRLAACGLTMHPEKSKIVFCRDSNRSERHPHASFTFLGFTFRPRKARSPQRGGRLPTSCREPARVP